VIVALALAGHCHGQSHVEPPSDAKPLHGERVGLELGSDSKNQAVLLITFYGSEPQIKYTDVGVRVFDKAGKEIPITRRIKEDAYANMGFGRYRSDASTGFYNPEEAEEHVAKVTIAWKGDEVSFSPPPRSKHITFKALHGGQVSVSIMGWPNDGRKVLDVLFKGIHESEVKYSQVKLTALDNHGTAIPVGRFAPERDTYISVSKIDGVFTSMYRVLKTEKAISKVTMKWGDDEVEFSTDDLIPH
jgi:hypothetical protein